MISELFLIGISRLVDTVIFEESQIRKESQAIQLFGLLSENWNRILIEMFNNGVSQIDIQHCNRELLTYEQRKQLVKVRSFITLFRSKILFFRI